MSVVTALPHWFQRYMYWRFGPQLHPGTFRPCWSCGKVFRADDLRGTRSLATPPHAGDRALCGQCWLEEHEW